MVKCYKHLHSRDRIKIYELLFEGVSIADIAISFGFHKSTIY